MNEKNCAVVIPHHRETFTQNEEVTLVNITSKLADWSIYLVVPDNLNLNNIYMTLKRIGRNVRIIQIRHEYLSSWRNYNRFCINAEFYKLFNAYKYMLLCQLDVWIFKDTLQYWLDKNYDYIGAPWPSSKSKKKILRIWDKLLSLLLVLRISQFNPEYVPVGGNGGLSLRNINAHIKILEDPMYRPNWNIFVKCLFHYFIRLRFVTLFIFIFKFFGGIGNPKQFFVSEEFNEDVYISSLLSLFQKAFKVAPPRVSKHFAVESNIKYELSKMKALPFGLHKWHLEFGTDELKALDF